MVRLGEALRIGNPGSRLIAAAIFILSPRVLTTLGSISSETLPMMLAPWVLLPMVRALGPVESGRPLWREALRSACAVALMGAVNAVATLAVVGMGGLWWLLSGPHGRRWLRFGLWWAAGLVLACTWWAASLLILSRVSPPFLDYIESSRVTTQWASLTELLRGASSWTPFVSPERVAGAVLVSQPAAVMVTGVLVAAGLAGLAMRGIPARGRLVTLLVVGLLFLAVGYAGTLGSPVAEPVRVFLDGAGAPLRNVHKFEPLVRLPAVLGVAHLLGRVPLPGSVPLRESAAAFAHPQRSRPVAAAIVVLIALFGAGSLAWTGKLAGDATYRDLPDHWRQAAAWLDEQARSDDGAAPARALVVPGAPFASQLWGNTRDEPLQPLAQTPWAVRDAIPLVPPGAIRALDSVQQQIASGRGSPGLADTLATLGVGFVLLRADLDPATSRSARPLLARQALEDSPGLRQVAVFGDDVGPGTLAGVIVDDGLRPNLPAITVYAVEAEVGFPGTGPVLVNADDMARVAGGPESLAALASGRARAGLAPLGPALLTADADRAGLDSAAPIIVTDTPADREVDFGRVDDHSSAIRTPEDPRITMNAAADYPVPGQPLVQGQWLLDQQPGRVQVTASGSAADATQLGQTSPANSTAAAFDGDAETAWTSRGLDAAIGEWLRLDFAEPLSNLGVTITTAAAIGSDVSTVLVSTAAGSTLVQGLTPGDPVTVAAPSGPTDWVEIRAVATDDGGTGNQFALAEVALSDIRTGEQISVRHRVVLPELDPGTEVAQWSLTQELSGRPSCVADGDRLRCSGALGLRPESPGLFSRTLSVPEATEVAPTIVLRPMPGAALTELLTDPTALRAEGPAGVTDPRGAPAAAVDGDPATSWIAPEPSGRSDEEDADDRDEPDSDRPTLTLYLPAPQEVSGLRLITEEDYPAAPQRVRVDLGDGGQQVEVAADGTVDLTPATTDRVEITVLEAADLISVNALGFANPAPTGIAEVEILPQQPPVADPDRPIVIGCDSDPTDRLALGMTVSGAVQRLSVETTAGALLAGEPVFATLCGSDAIALGAGEQELSVNPGSAFSVAAIELFATDLPATDAPIAGAAVTEPVVERWDAHRRVVEVPGAEAERVLVVPESTNPGWTASLDGAELSPVVVNGWQQGWVVPAGAAGTVTLTFAYDSLYRGFLVGGLALVALLFLLAWWPRRWLPDRLSRAVGLDDPDPVRVPGPDDSPRMPLPMATTVVAGLGWAVAAWLLTGWAGLLVAAGCALVTRWLTPAARVISVCGAMLLATVLLATGPWTSGDYAGDDLGPQLAALISLSLLVAAVLLPPPQRDSPPEASAP